MAVAPTLASLTFPQGPVNDPQTGLLSLEWFMWLQGLKFAIQDIIDIQILSSIFPSNAPATVSTVQKQVDALKVQLALIRNPSADIAKITQQLDAMQAAMLFHGQFNPGAIQQRINALETMGVFV